MLTNDQIRILLSDIENERVERTISTKDTDKFAWVICAFANDLSNKRQPSYLFIGAHENGSLCGLKVTDKLSRNLAGLCSDGNILPQPALMVEKVSFPKGDKREIKQQLASLKLFDTTHDRPTVGGILLVSKDPVHVLFGAYIQYVKFAGTSRTSRVLNERQFSGNLITILNEIDYFIKYTIQTQRPVFVTVLREEMRINYPEAIRELAMNMVMHRNYQTNAPVKFYEYSDRIEMDNLGNLYGKVRPDNFPNESDYRNPVIAETMKALGYVSFSRGVNMVQEMLEDNKNGLAKFNFKDITIFKVTVMNADVEAESDTENGEKGELNPANNENNIKNANAKNIDEVTGKGTERVTEKQQLILSK